MSKKAFYAALIIYTVLLVLPPVVYVLANFYTYLFDGWQLSAKFANAMVWILIVSCGYGIFGIVYSENYRKWGR